MAPGGRARPGRTLAALASALGMCVCAAVESSSRSSRQNASTVAALLADGRVVLIDATSSRELAAYPDQSVQQYSMSAGGRLSISPDRDEVFALLSSPSERWWIAGVRAGPYIGRRVSQAPSAAFPAVAVGRRSGHLYVLDRIGAKVIAVDPGSGETISARPVDGWRNDSVYSWGLRDDERRLFISYHGQGTGIDWFDVEPARWKRAGYVQTHGGFVLLGERLFAATGESQIVEFEASGRELRRLDTGLRGNHLMEFVIDRDRRLVHAVGSCGYAGGFSTIALSQKASARIRTPVGDYTVCGERVSVSPDGSWLAVASIQDPPRGLTPSASRAGALLIVSTRTGEVLQRITTASDVVDVLAVR